MSCKGATLCKGATICFDVLFVLIYLCFVQVILHSKKYITTTNNKDK